MEKYRHQQFSALSETIRQPAVSGHYGTGLATLGGHLCADGWWMRMKQQWKRDELADQWVLAPREIELLANKTRATRLGFAVLLKSFMLEGPFPRQKHDVPGAVVVHLANRVKVSADLYPSYEWSGRTIEYHRAQIREYLGFREATVQDGHELVEWLTEHVLPNDHREEQAREALFEQCRMLASSHAPPRARRRSQ